MTKYLGKFIVFEGSEGAGKTTQIALLKQTLDPQKYFFTKAPGSTRLGQKLRGILLDNDANFKLDSISELLLFMADHHDHWIKVIKPKLEQGITVIADRCIGSNFAYQIVGRKNEKLQDLFWDLVDLIMDQQRPNLTIFLDLDVKIGLNRRVKSGIVNRLDQEKIAFYERLRSGFLFLTQTEKNWHIINADRSESVVNADIMQLISVQ